MGCGSWGVGLAWIMGSWVLGRGSWVGYGVVGYGVVGHGAWVGHVGLDRGPWGVGLGSLNFVARASCPRSCESILAFAPLSKLSPRRKVRDISKLLEKLALFVGQILRDFDLQFDVQIPMFIFLLFGEPLVSKP